MSASHGNLTVDGVTFLQMQTCFVAKRITVFFHFDITKGQLQLDRLISHREPRVIQQRWYYLP